MDASASGADEIGIAMQRASATAQEAGVSFEWLGAYIATVSEKTRQAPESIGTAFNSIMSRLQSIKQMGFNEEDETKVNDVAKALSNIGVALMRQDGEWRNMSDIFTDISHKWSEMDDKARAYIATTIAGTRQKNVFLTLMNDMSKVTSSTGEVSRALELYTGALNSAGAASDKYAIWQESIAAAQGKFNAELEKLQGVLLNPEWIKAFYDVFTSLVSKITEGTTAFNGMNIVVPLVVSGVIGLTAAFGGAFTNAKSFVGVIAALWGVLKAHPVGLAVSAFTVLATAMTAFGTVFHESAVDVSENMETVEGNLTEIKTAQEELAKSKNNIEELRKKYVELTTQTDLTATEQAELKRVIEEIKNLSPELYSALSNETTAYAYLRDVVSALNDELEKKNKLSQAEIRQKARENFSVLDETITQTQEDLKKAEYLENLAQSYREFRKANKDLDEELARNHWAKKYLEDMDTLSYFERDVAHGDFFDYTGISAKESQINDPVKKLAAYIGDSMSFIDEAEVIRGQLEREKLLVQQTLLSFADMSELGPIFQTAAKNQIQALIDSFDFESGNYESQLSNISGQIVEVINNALQSQEEWNADSGKSVSLSQITDAYSKAMLTSLEEDVNAYNDLVKAWNAVEQTFKLSPIDSSFINSLFAVGEAAEEAAGGLDTASDAASEWRKQADLRQAKKDSGLLGFSDQLDMIDKTYNRAQEGRGAYEVKQYLDRLKEENQLIYDSMMQYYGDDLENLIYETDPAKAKQLLDNMKKYSEVVVGMEKAYYDSLYEAKETESALPEQTPTSLSEAQDYLQMFKDIMLAGGEDTGIASLLAELDTYGNDVITTLESIMPWLNDLSEGTLLYEDALKRINESLYGTAENTAAWMEAISFDDKFDSDEGLEFLSRLQEALGDSEAFSNFSDAWDSLEEDFRDNVKDLVDENDEWIDSVLDGTKTTENAVKDINKAYRKLKTDNLVDAGEVWEEVGEVIEDFDKTYEDAPKKMADSFGELEQKFLDLSEARTALSEAQSSEEGSTEFTDAITALNGVLPFAITGVQDLSMAEAWLTSQTNVATNSAMWLLNSLYAISGSSFNAGNWTGQLAALAASGDATAIAMQNLIQKLQNIDGARISFDGTTFSVTGLGSGGVGGGSSGGGSKGGGSGGSGGGSSSPSKVISEIEKMLDLMEQIQDFADHNQDMIQSRRDYYAETGELQGVIQCLEQEKKHILENNQVLDDNIKKIEAQMKTQQAKVAAMEVTDEQYEQEASDLEALQDAHQDYTKQLIGNRTALVELTNEIKEQRDAIRKMEIELRETILEAIEDREELEARMLEGTIDVQNEILDIIKDRYEKERDAAIEAAEAKIEALEAEKDALDELLEKRREAAEEEDKARELAELESKLARISADPTRKKEELELRKQIAELRDEMAWDLAEKEVEAQKEGIDQQITSLEEYIEYVEQYYEDLFKHPQKLITEMEKIMQMTDEQIIEWLKAHNEEYAASTEAMQESMVNEWNEMLMDMHGSIKTYWDEIEQIIAGGDDAIIEFLKQNGADYKAAGKLQAEAYVDEWKQQLEDLRKAHKEITEEINNTTYTVVKPSTGSSSSGSGGSSSGGSSSNNSTPTAPQWYLTINGKKTGNPVSTESEAARMAYLERTYGIQSGKYKPTDIISYARYKKGGLANFTGLAWLDGTKTKPERILSAYQTKLFEDMITSLHAIRVASPKMGTAPGISNADALSPMSFGDINISVESLADDTDYEEMAKKVMEVIAEKASRTSVVGGIRMTR